MLCMLWMKLRMRYQTECQLWIFCAPEHFEKKTASGRPELRPQEARVEWDAQVKHLYSERPRRKP